MYICTSLEVKEHKYIHIMLYTLKPNGLIQWALLELIRILAV